MKNLSRHTEWLSLIEISGPFITVSMLEKAFPQGLETVETPRRQKLRAAYNEWREAVDEDDRLLAELHREWIRLVLNEMLEYDGESLVPASKWQGESLAVTSPEHSGSFSPDWIVRSPEDGKPRLFISVLTPDTDLESVQKGDSWPVSFQERMTLLCRTHGIRIGLLTNGERWMLVNAPIGSTSSHVSWYARLWFQEPVTLKAFQSLLGVRRCFGPTEETLEVLLEESLKHHEEVTDTLGEQVRRAVEVLVQCLDKADEDRNRELLRDVKPAELYEAGLTVMMRLVFVLCAEERGLLLSGDSVYDQCYAVSTLRGQLAEEADRLGPEVLDRRHDTWARLLAVFRAVYDGIEHESLRMPAMGGSLFDPDRFPFLEGRAKGTHWRDTSAAPLPIDNRTVLLLLNSLQILEQPGGALLLSYRALDVEQIGHVYEGLLEHTVARVPRVKLGLQGSQKAKNPNVALAELQSARLDGDAALVKFILDITGRSESAIKNGLTKAADETIFGRVMGVCGGDANLAERIRPYANLLRTDAWEDPIVYRANSFMVTLGADRRETGTHYTPKSLTESIVTTTLEQVVYVGPAKGKPREEWTLKSSMEILEFKVCDPAMGSGAFLVQACRYLGEKLVEAWLHEEAAGKAITVDGEALDDLGAAEPMPSQLDERLTIARRLVAERCLYGVDVNPLAVELAKLSIWLVTLAKGRPFGFLDHNLRSGDSLLGIHRLEQLTRLSMKPDSGQHQLRIFGQNVEAAVREAIDLRKRLRSIPIRDIRDVEVMARLDLETRKKLESVELIADAMIGEALASGGNERTLEKAMDNFAIWAAAYIKGDGETGRKIITEARRSLSIDLPADKPPRNPFHWALEFPEVFERGGFDGIVGNPPFMGGKKISGCLGSSYREFIVEQVAAGVKGNADLCAFFFLRASKLLDSDGVFGLLATNTIAQGDTREVGLDQIMGKGSQIIKAIPSQKWPGKANLEVAIVWIVISEAWHGDCFINDNKVDGISSYLVDIKTVTGIPYQLKANDNIAYVGQFVHGDGFVLSPEEAAWLIKINPKNKDVLFEYLSGSDVTSRPDQSPSRWVINFFDWPLKREDVGFFWSDSTEQQKKVSIGLGIVPIDYPYPVAEDYPNCLEVVTRKVLPERMKLKDNTDGRKYKKYWWRYGRLQEKMLNGLDRVERILFHSFTSKYVSFTFSDKNKVFAAPHNVILLDHYSDFALLQSSIHFAWVLEYCSTHETRIRYAISDVLKTFPFPGNMQGIEEIGRTYYEHRQEFMTIYNEGLTDIYNRFHKSEELSDDIQILRELHINMDNAVATAYGWDDLDLGHGFHVTKQGIRFTVSEGARREVLQRMLKLNHERYEEEVKPGLY